MRLEQRRLLLDRGDNLDAVNEVKTSPIFTHQVLQHAAALNVTSADPLLPQYGLIAATGSTAKDEDMLYYNIAAPSSTFICGSQGSGKSHTLSCLLENCLIPSVANELPRPLTGIVFHYDTFISDAGGSPCEAAFLSTNKNLSVRVLCAPTNVATIRKSYSQLPNVTIEELRIDEKELNTKRMMDLMAVSTNGNIPLYLHVVNRILRDLRLEQQKTSSTFNYKAFRRMLDAEDLTIAQRVPLTQRLDTLESFMVKEQTGPSSKKSKQLLTLSKGNDWTPKPARLTIVDLSCPTVTAEAACSLFNICLSLFLEQNCERVGRVVALDEAHKYMNESSEASTLTAELLSTIRLQRHLGARIIISTQEPTISPKLLDLCSVTIVHRFTSPDWLHALQKHLAGVSAASLLLDKVGAGDASDEMDELSNGVKTMTLQGNNPSLSIFAQIVQLRVGEALLFAPSAILDVGDSGHVKKLDHGMLKVRVRNRVTRDGGKSVMAG